MSPNPTTPERLRIGMICPGYPSGAPGDYRGIFVQHMVQALKARGHAVCVLTSRIRPDDRPFARIDDLEEIHRFPFWSGGKLLIEHRRVPVARMITYMASALWHGRRVFRRFGCDLVHSHFLLPTGLIGAALASALRRPHLTTVHGSDMRMAVRPLMRPLARWTLARCQAVTYTARHQLDALERLGAGRTRLVQLHLGVHESFHGLSAAMRKAVAEKTIISTRTLRDDVYNISQLLLAMGIVARRDPEAALTIAGDGPDRECLEALARSLGLEHCVRFIGTVRPEKLAELLSGHRVYVSTSRADGASISLFEAMISGAYPVVSAIPANAEWIRNGENGALFPLDDPEALAQALLEAMQDAPQLQQAIDANRLTAQTTFTWEGVAFRLEEIYRKTLRLME